MINATNISAERTQQLIAQRIEAMPEDEWTWNHWLKALVLQSRILGLLKEGKGNMNVGTMNILSMQNLNDKGVSTASGDSMGEEEAIEATVISEEA